MHLLFFIVLILYTFVDPVVLCSTLPVRSRCVRLIDIPLPYIPRRFLTINAANILLPYFTRLFLTISAANIPWPYIPRRTLTMNAANIHVSSALKMIKFDQISHLTTGLVNRDNARANRFFFVQIRLRVAQSGTKRRNSQGKNTLIFLIRIYRALSAI